MLVLISKKILLDFKYIGNLYNISFSNGYILRYNL